VRPLGLLRRNIQIERLFVHYSNSVLMKPPVAGFDQLSVDYLAHADSLMTTTKIFMNLLTMSILNQLKICWLSMHSTPRMRMLLTESHFFDGWTLSIYRETC
jgi:hypothetical protein